jgi:hypothetical protein
MKPARDRLRTSALPKPAEFGGKEHGIITKVAEG